MRALVICGLFFIGIFESIAQVGEVVGTVVNERGEIIANAHIINASSTKGTITNVNGRFRLSAKVGDTLVFSMLSYSYLYYVVKNSDFNKEQRWTLLKQNYLLDEVSIFSYELTTNRPRTMPLRKPTVPDNEDIREPRLPAPASIMDPMEALYQAFSKRIKQLRILEELKTRDAFVSKLEEGNNREILLKITGMPRDELRPFLFYCQMGYDYIENVTDYELLMSLLNCYDSYVHSRDMREFMTDYE